MISSHASGLYRTVRPSDGSAMMRAVLSVLGIVALVIAALLLAACGGSQGPAAMPVTGDYAPQTLVQERPVVEHVISYGQSLSLGERSVVAYPTDLRIPGPDDYADVGLMFAGGTRPLDISGLVPFSESDTPVDDAVWNIGTPGETPLYGALSMLVDRPGTRIGSAAGRGGTGIVDLSRGTIPYHRLLAQVTAGRAISAGSTYSVLAVLWLQGEADPGNANYAGEFEQLVMDLDNDVRAITGQSAPLQFYVCTTAVPDIAAAQRTVAAAMPQVHIACDTATYAKSDGTHLTAASSRQVGEALGQSIQETGK